MRKTSLLVIAILLVAGTGLAQKGRRGNRRAPTGIKIVRVNALGAGKTFNLRGRAALSNSNIGIQVRADMDDDVMHVVIETDTKRFVAGQAFLTNGLLSWSTTLGGGGLFGGGLGISASAVNRIGLFHPGLQEVIAVGKFK